MGRPACPDDDGNGVKPGKKGMHLNVGRKVATLAATVFLFVSEPDQG